MVWKQLTDHLEVLYGAITAFVIVLVLTPVVGRGARYLRLMERPHEGERSRSTILPLGGELRGVVLGAAVATTVGAIDDFRRLRWWQKLSGQVLAAAIPVWFGVYVHA